MDQLSNSETQLEALNKQLVALGADSMKSALAKPQMALAVIRAAFDGLVNEKDAKHIYAKYAEGRNKAAGKNTITHGLEDNEKSMASNTSKVKSQIMAAQLPGIDFVQVANDVIDIRKSLVDGGAKVKDVYQAITDAAVQQKRQPDKQLDAEALAGIIAKEEKDEKSDLDKVIDEYKRVYRLAKGSDDKPGIPEVEPALAALGAAIQDMGGDLPAMTKEEKKEADALAFLKSRGTFTLIPATPAPAAE